MIHVHKFISGLPILNTLNEWKVEGKVEERQVEDDKVCKQPTTYRLLLTEDLGQKDAVATCDKLGHGTMVEAASKDMCLETMHQVTVDQV